MPAAMKIATPSHFAASGTPEQPPGSGQGREGDRPDRSPGQQVTAEERLMRMARPGRSKHR